MHRSEKLHVICTIDILTIDISQLIEKTRIYLPYSPELLPSLCSDNVYCPNSFDILPYPNNEVIINVSLLLSNNRQILLCAVYRNE